MAVPQAAPAAAQDAAEHWPTPPEDTDVPQHVRQQAAEAHEQVYPAVNDARWGDAAAAGRTVLTLLQTYPKADQAYHFRVEKAWAYFALGMQAKSQRRPDEAIVSFQRVVEMLPPAYQTGLLPLEALNQLALTYADKGDFARTAETYRQLLRAIEQHQHPVNVWLFWMGLGRTLERLGGTEDRAEAIRAYLQAIRTQPVRQWPEEWTHEACAGIVRCTLAGRQTGARLFWQPWSGRWLSLCFAALCLTALSFSIAAAIAALGASYVQAGWRLGLSAVPFGVILLPSLHSVSGPGWAIELQDLRPEVPFAFDLKHPAG